MYIHLPLLQYVSTCIREDSGALRTGSTPKFVRFGNIFNAYFFSYKQLYEVEFRLILKYHETTKNMAKLSSAHCFVNGIWKVSRLTYFALKCKRRI